MLLLISTTHCPATDLGYLLHKNPSRIQRLGLSFGEAIVAYPEATEQRTTAALLVQMDPIRTVRGKGDAHGALASYVNDRPYVASSFLSVALAEAFGTALSGRSKERQELADTAIPLEVQIPVLPSRWGEAKIRALFEPLGWTVQATRLPLDEKFPEWGESRYYDVTLTGTTTVKSALRQLYLLLPALDANKHYYMDSSEVEKLVHKGEGWLPDHPEKNWILRSSLGRRPSLLREALEQLANAEAILQREAEETDDEQTPRNQRAESLHQQRHARIIEWIKQERPESVVDVGCGDGKLLRQLIPINGIRRILGMDVSYFELEKANRYLKLEDAGPKLAERIQLIHGSLMYRDDRLRGFDVCTVVEVIEHLDPPRLSTFEKVIFGYANPRTVLLTTPNREYNAVYGVQELRHEDHRFEWTRAEFQQWCERVAGTYGYSVAIEGIGEVHEEYGAPSQMAVFVRCS